jgi:hypothetical protein
MKLKGHSRTPSLTGSSTAFATQGCETCTGTYQGGGGSAISKMADGHTKTGPPHRGRTRRLEEDGGGGWASVGDCSNKRQHAPPPAPYQPAPPAPPPPPPVGHPSTHTEGPQGVDGTHPKYTLNIESTAHFLDSAPMHGKARGREAGSSSAKHALLTCGDWGQTVRGMVSRHAHAHAVGNRAQSERGT